MEKQPIVSGILVDTHEEHGLPTLHCVLDLALTSVSSGLLTIGAICSAVCKKNSMYMFSHGENGLSSGDGISILISFSTLDDLVSSPEPKAHKVSLQDRTRAGVRVSVCPCVCVCVCPLTISNMNISKTRGADCNQILSEASLGWGKACIRF